MVIIGLLLLAVAAVAVVAVLQAGGDAVVLRLHWFTVHTNGRALFLAGAATLVVAVVGAVLLRAGLRRSRRRRRELKDLRTQAAAGRSTTTKSGADRPTSGSASRPAAGDADSSFDSAPRD